MPKWNFLPLTARSKSPSESNIARCCTTPLHNPIQIRGTGPISLWFAWPDSWVQAKPRWEFSSRANSRGVSRIWTRVSSSPPASQFPAIFERRGEAAFREIEREQLEKTLGRVAESGEAVVLALGGGTYAQPGIVERLRNVRRSGYLARLPGRPAARALRNHGQSPSFPR